MDTKRHHMLKEIRLSAQMLTFLGSIVKISWGVLYDHLRKRSFTLIMNKMFIGAVKFMWINAMALIWTCQSLCSNNLFHILGEMGAELKCHFRPAYLTAPSFI